MKDSFHAVSTTDPRTLSTIPCDGLGNHGWIRQGDYGSDEDAIRESGTTLISSRIQSTNTGTRNESLESVHISQITKRFLPETKSVSKQDIYRNLSCFQNRLLRVSGGKEVFLSYVMMVLFVSQVRTYRMMTDKIFSNRSLQYVLYIHVCNF